MKILLTSILIFISIQIYSQSAISVIGGFQDFSIGPEYSYKYNKLIFSTGASIGDYRLDFLDHHYEIYNSIGYFNTDRTFFVAGINYNKCDVIGELPPWFNEKALQTWTISAGGGIILDHFIMSINADLVQHVGVLTFGYYFGNNKYSRRNKY